MDDEDEEGELPEMEEDEIAFEEGLMANMEGFTNDKETTEDKKLHPKLIPLLLSMVFMLISFTVVSYSFSFVFKWSFLSMSRNINIFRIFQICTVTTKKKYGITIGQLGLILIGLI